MPSLVFNAHLFAVYVEYGIALWISSHRVCLIFLFVVLLNTGLKYIHVNQMGMKKIFFFCLGNVYTLFISEFLIIGVHV